MSQPIEPPRSRSPASRPSPGPSDRPASNCDQRDAADDAIPLSDRAASEPSPVDSDSDAIIPSGLLKCPNTCYWCEAQRSRAAIRDDCGVKHRLCWRCCARMALDENLVPLHLRLLTCSDDADPVEPQDLTEFRAAIELCTSCGLCPTYMAFQFEEVRGAVRGWELLCRDCSAVAFLAVRVKLFVLAPQGVPIRIVPDERDSSL
jgi:hypothetical protein